MSKKKNDNDQLSARDLGWIKHNEEIMLAFLNRLKEVTQFKLNDYLIAYKIFPDSGQKVPITNSYGTPIKYKVVHTDKAGIPYIKMVASSGAVVGDVQALVIFDPFDGTIADGYHYTHDPHFVESIILEDKTYDPTEIQRNKKLLRDEIVKHNREAKINTKDLSELIKTFNSMNVGEKYWFSIKNNMTINRITIVPASKHVGALTVSKYSKQKIKDIPEIEVTLSNGSTDTYYPHVFLGKNLYTKQPRSINEIHKIL